MLEIIALIYLTRKMGDLALSKGLRPRTWKVYTLLAWIGAEFLGFIIGIMLFGTGNIIGLMLFGLICAVGGYLYVHALLEKQPGNTDDDINNIGS
jgi:hypothetical protein